MDRSERIILISLLVIVAACLCVSLPFLALFGPGVFGASPTHTAQPPPSTQRPRATSTPEPSMTSTPLNAEDQTLLTLSKAVFPVADPYSLASRFNGKVNVPPSVTIDPQEYALGDSLNFWTWQEDDETNRQVHATLRYATDEVYIWIEDQVPYQSDSLKILGDTFADEIVPKDHAFFGSEPIPGVDNDPHLYVLFAQGLGESIAGYMSAADGVLPAVFDYSNGHEMFNINADIQSFDDPYTLGVMAHELQHLIHSSQDPNEDLWLNEGFAELATLINGYQTGGFDSVFLQDPDLQLNDWANEEEESISHYGASFLFVSYMLGRFGEEFTRSVVANELNGFDSIDAVLNEFRVTDPQSGLPVSADQVFAEWAVANYLQDDSIADGRYGYSAYPSAPHTGVTERQTECIDLQRSRDVAQFGTDYIQLVCGAPSLFTFQGQAQVPVIPIESGDESAFMWSNSANSSDMMLTHKFDFRGVEAPIQLTFDTWYDLESNFDYGYVLVSEDEGVTWTTMVSTSCTRDNSTGNNYGCGFTGTSGGWLSESVNLTHYAGEQVMVRFESITDAAILGEGLVVDNVSIPQIGYSEDFNTSDGGWIGEGFMRIANVLPQTFLVSVIDEGTQVTVSTYSVQAGEKLEIPIRAGNDLHPVTILVSGSTEYTRQKAQYEYAVEYAK